MVENTIDGRKWTSKAMEKLKAFLERAPILVSNIIGTENGKDGVFIILESTKTKKFFPFEYELEPKVWVHNIKEALIPDYPRLFESITESHILTPAEKAELASERGTISNIPDFEERVVLKNCWRIDKVLHYRDIFILYLEGTATTGEDGKDIFKESKEHIMRRFKYCSSSVLFLKKIRNNEFADMESWSKDFFENSIPLDNLKIKET